MLIWYLVELRIFEPNSFGKLLSLIPDVPRISLISRCNQNDDMVVSPDVINIDYNGMVSFGYHQKCFLVLKVWIMESFCSKGHENELDNSLYRISREIFSTAKKLVWIKEIIQLWEAELQRVNCIPLFEAFHSFKSKNREFFSFYASNSSCKHNGAISYKHMNPFNFVSDIFFLFIFISLHGRITEETCSFSLK